MQEPPAHLPDTSRDAIHAQKNAAQAVEVARLKQINEVAERVTENIPDEERIAHIVREQMLNVLAFGTEHEKSIILARVPYICQDIKNINARGERIEQSIVELKDNISSFPIIRNLVFGFVGMILTSVVGALIALVVVSK